MIARLSSIAALVFLSTAFVQITSAQQTKRPFTVADEIGLTLFGDAGGGKPEVHFSPDGNYFAVWAERGRLDLNRVEDSLRFYSSRDVEKFLEHSDESQPLSPVWIVTLATFREGRIIREWRWLADSSAVVFLERTTDGDQRLVLANLRKKIIEPLTSASEVVNAFEVRDRDHYVYTVADPAPLQKLRDEHQRPAVVGTGRPLTNLLFPDDPLVRWFLPRRNHLWAVVAGKRFEVKSNGAPVVVEGDMALSPGGDSLVTTVPVSDVPSSWEALYPPPYPSYFHQIHAGGSATEYARINLRTGSVQPLTDAPVAWDGGWTGNGKPSWSSDGQGILLPDTFVKSKENLPSRPCVVVVDLPSNARTCVEVFEGLKETATYDDSRAISEARFAGGDKQRVMVGGSFQGQYRTNEYQRTADGRWQLIGHSEGRPVEHNGLVTVKQGFNEPPLLVATDKQTSRVLWDPNPQLKNFDLGQATVYTWKGKEGRAWKGGLFKPTDYKPGQRYPLVIQTHGFTELEFRPSGVFTTAFAARALAGAGIVVLQVYEGLECPDDNPEEAPCEVSVYEFAAAQLVSEGLVDPERIGIIGFSRTCFHVMEALTNGSFHAKAASITDGFMVDYLQYIVTVDASHNSAAHEYDSILGKPFGGGLQQWLKRSQSFNLDRVNAPLMVVGEGPYSLLLMWQPYAGLRYLEKPVDLIMLNTREHTLTNPAVRMASQGGSVDWFRFWLQDYEDPDPAKSEQYARWRELRKMQAENEKKLTTPQATSK